MKRNSLPDETGAQVKEVIAPCVLLTLSILMLNSVPDPFSPVAPSLTMADMRAVLNVPGPVLRMAPETVQAGDPPVSPAAATYGVAKPTTAESKRKSPWKPI